MEKVCREPRRKQRKITLHRANILNDIDLRTYKLAESSVADPEVRDHIQSDADEHLDGALLGSAMDARDAQLRKRLAFCIDPEGPVEVDDTADLEGEYEFVFLLPVSFKDANLKTAAKKMHDYIAKGALMDWYNDNGTQYAATLAVEVTELESQIVDIFRVPGVVRHPRIVFIPSYKIR